MNIKIDLNVCRVCLQGKSGTIIYTGDILEKFLYTTLVQVIYLQLLINLLLHRNHLHLLLLIWPESSSFLFFKLPNYSVNIVNYVFSCFK